MAIRVSQIGIEAWVKNPSQIRVSQIGLETWRSTLNAPAPTVGNADGVASVSGIVGSSGGAGHADGFATVAGTSQMPAQTIGHADGTADVIAFTPVLITRHPAAALMVGI